MGRYNAKRRSGSFAEPVAPESSVSLLALISGPPDNVWADVTATSPGDYTFLFFYEAYGGPLATVPATLTTERTQVDSGLTISPGNTYYVIAQRDGFPNVESPHVPL